VINNDIHFQNSLVFGIAIWLEKPSIATQVCVLQRILLMSADILAKPARLAGPHEPFLKNSGFSEESMPRFCSSCGAAMAEGATTCPACGKSATQSVGGGTGAAPATATTSGMSDNVAGMLAYVTIIPAIVFLVVEPYNRNRFIRFHAFQNIFFNVAWIVLWIALSIVGNIPVLGWASLLIWPLIGLGGLVIWVVLLLKSYQGQMFKLPIIGNMAEKQANG